MQKKSKKILLIIGTLERGGAEVHLSRIAGPLCQRGLSIKIVSLKRGGELEEPIKNSGVEIITPHTVLIPWSRLLTRITRLAHISLWLIWVYLKERPYIVHFFLPEAYCIGSIASILVPIRHRIMSRRSLSDYKVRRPFLGWFEDRVHTMTDYFIGNSSAVCKELATEKNVPRDRVLLLHNGIIDFASPPLDRISLRHRLNLPVDRIIFVLVANLIPYKGHRELIKALGLLKAADIFPHVVCIGRDDSFLGELQELAQAEGVDASITWTGTRAAVSPYLFAADVGLNCSHEEGFSNAILEAMSASLPVIATRVGGNSDAVLDGITGVLVEPRDPAALAQAMSNLIHDAHLREIMGCKGRARIEEKFSIECCLDMYENLYRSLLETDKIIENRLLFTSKAPLS